MMLQQVAQELANREFLMGQDALFAECDAIYDGKFRTQPEPASELLDGEWWSWEEFFADTYGIELKADTPVCVIVNYKGEEDGDPAPLSMVEHLQVFHGKYDYR